MYPLHTDLLECKILIKLPLPTCAGASISGMIYKMTLNQLNVLQGKFCVFARAREHTNKNIYNQNELQSSSYKQIKLGKSSKTAYLNASNTCKIGYVLNVIGSVNLFTRICTVFG